MGEKIEGKVQWFFNVDVYDYLVVSKPCSLTIKEVDADKTCVKLPNSEGEIDEIIEFIVEEYDRLSATPEVVNGMVEKSSYQYVSNDVDHYFLSLTDDKNFRFKSHSFQNFNDDKGITIPGKDFQLWFDYFERALERAKSIESHRTIIELSD